MAHPTQAVLCLITVQTAQSSQAWSGIFKSTLDALIDALERFGGSQAKITVRAVRQ